MGKANIFLELKRCLPEHEMWEYNQHTSFLKLIYEVFGVTDIDLMKGILFLKLSSIKKAEFFIKKFLSKNSKSASGNALLGSILMRQKEYVKAKKYFSKVNISTNPLRLDLLTSWIFYAYIKDFPQAYSVLLAIINILNEHSHPIHFAVELGFVEFVKYIVKFKNSDINAKDFFGWTALHCAAWLDESEILQILLDNSAEIEAKGNQGETALYLAAFNGHETSVEILLQNSANMEIRTNYSNTPMHMACYNEHIDIMQQMLKYGVDINIRTTVRNNTPLHVAAWHGKCKSAAFLLDNACDINAKIVNGGTALHRAALNGQKEMILLLLNRGASTNCLDNYNRSPAYCASKNNYTECYKILTS